MVGLDPVSLKEWYDYGLEDLRYKYDLKPGDVIIDGGAFEGSWARRIDNENPGLHILCFEPNEAINDCNWASVSKAALWIHEGEIELSGERFATSIVGDHKKTYPCVDIAEVIEPFDNVKLLKLNIELAEYEVVEHLILSGAINKVENLQVQFHTTDAFDYVASYEALAKELIKTHKLSWRYPYCWENWERL